MTTWELQANSPGARGGRGEYGGGGVLYLFRLSPALKGGEKGYCWSGERERAEAETIGGT